MPFVAGQIVRASALNRIQPVSYTASQSNGGSLALTTSQQTCPGTTINFSTTTAAVCTVSAFFDFDTSGALAGVLEGTLFIDGIAISGAAHGSTNTVNRNTDGEVWRFTLSGAGAHTALLKAQKFTAGATAVTDDLHTRLVLTVSEIV